jgi:hypothetical protein
MGDREIARKPRKKKERAPRVKKVNVDMAKHLSAIVDGKFVALPGSGVVFFRKMASGKRELHEGTVHSVEDKVITVWDDTKGQFYVFTMDEELPEIRVTRAVTVAEPPT